MDEEFTEIARAVPEGAWEQLVETACSTFEKVLAPITETTSGIGRLIAAKFDRMVEAEKVLAAKMLRDAQERARKAPEAKNNPRPSILIGVIERSSIETDPILRELWTNMLAGEFAGNIAHPEFLRILERMDALDARLLANLAEESRSRRLRRMASIVISKFPTLIDPVYQEAGSFNHEQLRTLGLINRDSGVWLLTDTGGAFLEAVSDPSMRFEDEE